MKRMVTVLLAFALLLSLAGCKKHDAGTPTQTDPQPTQQAAPQPLPQLPNLEAVTVTGKETAGRAPGGEYTLPEKLSTLMEWQWNGAVALLAQEEDVAFYATEGKESNPGLLCWGDSQAEFDWWYMTPRSIDPQLWYDDIDGDGEKEVLFSGYGASGTGVSMEYFYVVERGEDGTLTSIELPWNDVCKAIEAQMQIVEGDGSVYAALAKDVVDITATMEELKLTANDVEVYLGAVTDYEWKDGELHYTFGVMLDGEKIPIATVYVGEVTGTIVYAEGRFTLDGLYFSPM